MVCSVCGRPRALPSPILNGELTAPPAGRDTYTMTRDHRDAENLAWARKQGVHGVVGSKVLAELRAFSDERDASRCGIPLGFGVGDVGGAARLSLQGSFPPFDALDCTPLAPTCRNCGRGRSHDRACPSPPQVETPPTSGAPNVE